MSFFGPAAGFIGLNLLDVMDAILIPIRGYHITLHLPSARNASQRNFISDDERRVFTLHLST